MQRRRILVCPLDWGLGHATRCIPIIRLLQKHGDVIIAADGRPYDLLKLEFPSLEFIRLPGYDIRYNLRTPLAVQMLLSTPRIIRGIRREQEETEKIVKDKNIDCVISDNRYGCYASGAYNIFITHQLSIITAFAQGLLRKINYSLISKFNECWIPDLEDAVQNLSSELSHRHTRPPNAVFIGPLSRLKTGERTATTDILAIVSGPDPLRQHFEDVLKKQLLSCGRDSILVAGRPDSRERHTEGRLQIWSHMNSEEMSEAIASAKVVVCRSGYSTLMDLSIFGKKCILVPTPGQTEQEYLSRHLAANGHAYTTRQSELDISRDYEKAMLLKGLPKMENTETALTARIEKLMLFSD